MFGSTKTNISTDEEKIKDIIETGTEDVFIKESLEKKLLSGKQLRVKLGFDPTGSNIHIGRAAILWKLRDFQDLGHKIVFIVGDFTARIGDPSDKISKRPMLSPEDIKENLKDYKNQVGKIIDLSKAEFRFNSEWLLKLGFNEIADLAESFSVQQMSNRRNFKDRFDKGEDVSLREFLYPLMQGYDSVAVGADVEIAGFDQLFNLKAGRVIQKHYGQPEQDVLTIKMLLGTDGRKMSTSWGNVINIVDEPSDMFGKVMSINDELIEDYFLMCTRVSKEYIEKIKKDIAGGLNPRDAKLDLAEKIVALYHDERKALQAKDDFVKTFSKSGVPSDVPAQKAKPGEKLVDAVLRAETVSSKSEWRRLVEGNAISNAESGEKITDTDEKITEDVVLKIGKHRFLKIVK